MTKQKTCAERVEEHLQSRIDDLEKLFRAYQEGEEERHSDELGIFTEYDLCFDYVAPGTFDDQAEGYFRYQLSWGGPSDEFRFFTNPDFSIYRIEYWFLDWFDGASIRLYGSDYNLIAEIFEFFNDIGSVQGEFEKSTE